MYYRDRAFDEFIEVAIGFRKDISLILQRPDWNESEKHRLVNMMREVYELNVKIYDYVRKNKSNEKRP